MNRLCFLLGLYIWFPNQLIASGQDSLKGAYFYDKAESFFRDLAFDSANQNYKKSMAFFKADSAWKGYFESMYSIGFIARDQSQFKKADSIFQHGMKECEKAIGKQTISWVKMCRGRGLLRQKNNEFDSAIIFLNQGLKVFDSNPNIRDRMELLLWIGLADCHYRLGFYEEALDDWKTILKVAKARYQDPKYDNYIRRKAIAHEQIGWIYGHLGEFTKAEAYLKEATEYFVNNINSRRDYYFVIKHFNTLGGVYLDGGRYEKALKAYHKAKNLATKHLPKGDLAQIYAYSNLGDYYVGINNDSASWYSSRSQDLINEYAPGARYLLAAATSNLGRANLNLGRLEKALSSFEEVIDIIKSFSSKDHLYLVNTYHRIAKVYKAMGHSDLALKYYEMSLQANSISLAREPNLLDGENRLYLSIPWFAETIYEKSRLEIALAANITDKEKVLRNLDDGISMTNESRNQISFEQDKSVLTEKLHQFHALGASLCQNLYHETNDSKYLKKFFTYSEMDKAFSLRTAINRRQMFKLAGVPAEEQKHLSGLSREIKKVEATLANEEKIKSENEDWKHLLVLKRNQEDYFRNLEKNYPALEAFNESNSEADLNMTMASLEPGKGVVEFFVIENDVYMLIVTQESSKLIKTEKVHELYTFARELRGVTKSVDSRDFYEISNKLYEVVFEPVESYLSELNEPIDRIVIVPDSFISLIPFDALISNPGQRTYLMEKYTISYEPSIMVAMTRSPKKNPAKLLAGFAPNFENEDEEKVLVDNYLAVRDTTRGILGSLPGALQEVNTVSSVFDGDVFTFDLASEINFRANASDYAILHLATHALVDHERPDNSKLILTAKKNNEHDGYLHAYEIYNMNLNAQLVTLSACNTGFGKIQKGEGVMSLSRAFAYAGVPATVVSLWPASDKSTPELMKYFYQNLKDGQPKDLALNNARKSYLANAKGKARHPFYWGGFVLIGDNSAIEEDRNLLIYLIPSVLIIVMILTLYRRKKQVHLSNKRS